jgi:hypothetical protein
MCFLSLQDQHHFGNRSMHLMRTAFPCSLAHPAITSRFRPCFSVNCDLEEGPYGDREPEDRITGTSRSQTIPSTKTDSFISLNANHIVFLALAETGYQESSQRTARNRDAVGANIPTGRIKNGLDRELCSSTSRQRYRTLSCHRAMLSFCTIKERDQVSREERCSRKSMTTQ